MFGKRKEETCGDKVLKALATTAEYLRKIVEEKISSINASINAKLEKIEDANKVDFQELEEMVGDTRQSVLFGLEKLINKSDAVAIIKAIEDSSARVLSKVDNKLNEIDKIKIEVDTKLNEFYREFTDKYFENLNSFMRWNKDLALASKFKDDKDFSKLKRDMLLPFIKADWEQKKALTAVDINKVLASKGGALVKITELLEKQVIALGREEKPVDELKELIKNIKDLSNEDNQDTTISDSDTTPSV